MKALLLIAHGSRRAESNQEIAFLTAKVEALVGESFELTTHAFLEMAAPSIDTAIDNLVEKGINHILVLPYFLARGAHVASDIPEVIGLAKQKHPSVTIHISDYFGAAAAVPELLVEIALASR